MNFKLINELESSGIYNVEVLEDIPLVFDIVLTIDLDGNFHKPNMDLILSLVEDKKIAISGYLQNICKYYLIELCHVQEDELKKIVVDKDFRTVKIFLQQDLRLTN